MQINALDKAKTQLTIHHPFISSLLLRRTLKLDPEIPTANIDRRGQISLNPDFIATMSVGHLQFLLAHECLHHALAHTLRRNGKNPQMWNSACDAVINETLIASRIGEFIKGGVRWPGAANLSAEDVYAQMLQDPDNQPSGEGGIGEDLDETGDPMDESQKAEAVAEAQRELVEARASAKMCGKLPAGLSRLVAEALIAKVPWYTILAEYMSTKIKSDYSWQRPNRRYIHAGIYLPGHDHKPTMGEVVIAIDTSGSVSEYDLGHYQGHINAIVQTCNPERVTVLYCDYQIQGVDQFGQSEEIKFHNLKGGGGTAFNPVFDYISEQVSNPEMLVYFTDLEGYFPDTAPAYPTVWVTDTQRHAPFGKTVRYYK